VFREAVSVPAHPVAIYLKFKTQHLTQPSECPEAVSGPSIIRE